MDFLEPVEDRDPPPYATRTEFFWGDKCCHKSTHLLFLRVRTGADGAAMSRVAVGSEHRGGRTPGLGGPPLPVCLTDPWCREMGGRPGGI